MEDLNRTDTANIFQEIGFAYFKCDPTGEILEVNQNFCRIVGLDQKSVIGKNIFNTLSAEDIRSLKKALDRNRADGKITSRDLVISSMGGGPQLVDCTISPEIERPGLTPVLYGVLRPLPWIGQMEEHLQAVERELEIARDIQASFLPQDLPHIPGWQITAYFEAAREVAGDFYDVFTLSSGRRIGLVMADVVDKGVGAALFMALFRSLIRAFADQHYKLSWMDVLSEEGAHENESASLGHRRKMLSTGTTALKNAINLTNNYIATNHGDTNMFATIFIGVLDPSNGSLMYINAGHEPPILVRENGEFQRLDPTGPAVGMLPDMLFNIENIRIGEKDTLFAYTDGVIDALNPSGETFGEEQLLNLARGKYSSTDELIMNLVSELKVHISDRSQYDDITMFALRREPTGSSGTGESNF
jgi:sigma-B regulation protein RsbU (phosphoserine phosphatase)